MSDSACVDEVVAVFEVQHGGQSSGTARYKLTSTVLVSIGTDSAERGTTRMGGSTTKQVLAALWLV